MTAYQLLDHGNQCQEILLDGEVEGILLLEVDRD
jgi:hypothetical protein